MKSIESIKLKGNPHTGLISAIMALFMGYSTVSFFGATAPILKKGMLLTPDEVGLLVAIPALTGGLLRIPSAAWADTNGGRKPTLILLITTLIGLFSFAIIAKIYPDGSIPRSLFPILLLSGAFVGTGIGIFTVGVAHVSYWYKSAHQGFPLGIYSGLGGIAGGLVTATIPFGISAVGFFGIYVLWFCFTLIGTITYFFISANPYYFQLTNAGISKNKAIEKAESLGQEIFPKGSMIQGIVSVMKNIKCWSLSFIYLSTFGGSVALITWLPTYFTSHYGLSLKTAGVLTGASAVISPIMRIGSGWLSDRHSAEKISIVALIVSFLSGIVLAFSSSVLVSFISIFIMVAGIGMSNGSLFKLVPIYVKGAVGTASGMIGGIGALGGFIIPPILGMVVVAMGQIGYARGFLLFSVLFFICLILMISLYLDSKKKGIKGV